MTKKMMSWLIRQRLKELAFLRRGIMRSIDEEHGADQFTDGWRAGSLTRIDSERKALGSLHWKVAHY